MSLPLITMQPPSGQSAPTMVHLPDATTVFPNASGQISISSKFVEVMLAAGWSIVVSSGTTHVP